MKTHNLERFLSLSISLAMAIYEMGWEKYEEVLSPHTRVGWRIPPKAKLGINCPVNIKCIYYRQTKRRVDLTNLLAATHDLLVESGVLADDNCNIIVSVDGSRVYYLCTKS